VRKFVCFCSIFLATSSFAEEWAWALTPYVWVIDVDMDTSLDEPSGGSTEFSDILDILDFAALVHFEGHKDRFGFLVDIQYFELSDRTTHGSIQVDTDTSAALIEGAVIVALSDGAERTELLFGIRSIVGKLEVEFETTGPGGFIRREKEDKALVDAMVGIRHTRPLSDKWAFNVRGDIAAGDTDFSWNVELGVARQVGDSGTLHLVYRHLNIEADLGSLEPELTLFGPMIGYTFHF
jgi:hypothetical protein